MTTSLLIRSPEDLGRLYERIFYPAGELQVRLTAEGLKAVESTGYIRILHRGVPDLMELLLLCDAVGRVAEFAPVSLVLPYLPYSRADRRFVEGDCAGLAVFGQALNGLGLEEVVTLDAHSLKASRHIPRLRSISPEPYFNQAFREVWRISKGWPTLLLPDEGANKRYDFISDRACDTQIACATKIRDVETGKLSGFEVPKDLNRHVLIVDDICDGGGTFIGIAEKLPKDTKKYLYVTHGIFSKGFRALLPTFERVYTTDSLTQQPQPQLTVLEAVKDLI